eukprot:Skav206861  [mRNA]  locus=scaffold1667:352441:356238:- [translate_table: standard]
MNVDETCMRWPRNKSVGLAASQADGVVFEVILLAVTCALFAPDAIRFASQRWWCAPQLPLLRQLPCPFPVPLRIARIAMGSGVSAEMLAKASPEEARSAPDGPGIPTSPLVA